MPSDPSTRQLLIVTNQLGCGGAARSLLRLGQGLVARGYAVTYVTTARRGEWFDRPRAFGADVMHVAGHGRWYPPLQALRVGLRLRACRPDVVCFSTETYGLSALNLLPDQVAAIVMCRSDEPAAYRANLANPLAWNVAVAVGPKILEGIRRRLPARPALVIPNGVDPVDPGRLAGRAPLSAPLRLLFVGRLVQHEKNVLLLPAIVRACRERGVAVTLTMLGAGPDQARVMAEMQRLEVGDHVNMVGSVTPEMVPQYMLDAHVLLLPSFFEGAPNVVLEAQACGCVPVAAHLPGVTDAVLAPGVTGMLVTRAHAEDYAACIADLASDPDRWRRMSAAGPAWVQARAAPARTVDAYEELIRAVLAGAYPLPRSRRRGWPVHPASFTWRQWVPKWIRFWRHPLHHLGAWAAHPRGTEVWPC